MANQFDSIFVRKPRRNKFNLSFQNKLTMKFGQLVPFMVQDTLPGDRFKVGSSHVIRLQPTVAPVMQNVMIYKHYFFVPYRLLWADWEKFITGGVSGAEKPDYPTIRRTGVTGQLLSMINAGGLSDYLGFPSPDSFDKAPANVNIDFDMLPFLAYQLIYQEYYRDQNLLAEAIDFPVDADFIGNVNHSSDDAYIRSLLTLRQRAWKKDEFTSALPWPQRSPVGVSLPVNVESTAYDLGPTGINIASWGDNGRANLTPGAKLVVSKSLGEYENGLTVNQVRTENDEPVVNVMPASGIGVRSEASLASISELRRAFKVQEWLEAMATGGSRYVEQIKRIFGVRTSDGRMQRPIYLGGSTTPLVMEQTAQTSQTSGDSVQGNLAGNGASVSSDFIFKNRFEEHGFIMGIMSIIPRASYFQGMPQKYCRRDRYEFYWPQFAHIGEQPIAKGRLYYQFEDTSINSTGNAAVFGYQPRYAEYRFNNDEIHGEFRTNLDQWHMARKFNSPPNLNINFVSVQPSVANGVFSVSDYLAAPFLCLINNNILASRLVSKYGTSHL